MNILKSLNLSDRTMPVMGCIIILMILLSYLQGLYHVDPHHAGLMLSNALDLLNGKLPYKDIFIQYGVLTTIIHAASLLIFGEKLSSITLMTSIFYTGGMIGIYCISKKIGLSKKSAYRVFLLSCFAHFIVIYPWANYLAFPFLVFGLHLLIPRHRVDNDDLEWESLRSISLGAVLLSAATLCREGIFAPLLVFSIFYAAVIIGLSSRKNDAVIRLLVYTLSLMGLWVIFFSALYFGELINYWYELSVKLPRLYANHFLPDGIVIGGMDMVIYFFQQIGKRNIRYFFYTVIFLLAFWVFIATPAKISRTCRNRWDVWLLACMSLLLLSASIHLHDLFRVATGLGIFTCGLFFLIKKEKYQKIIFIAFLLLFVLTLFSRKSGNPFLPQSSEIGAESSILEPSIFKGQRWPADVKNYYTQFESSVQFLKNKSCGINFHFNATRDAFLDVLSSFDRYQIAPFGEGLLKMNSWNSLRTDLDWKLRQQKYQDLLIFEEVDSSRLGHHVFEMNYAEIGRQKIPVSYFFKEDRWLVISAPKICLEKDEK